MFFNCFFIKENLSSKNLDKNSNLGIVLDNMVFIFSYFVG